MYDDDCDFIFCTTYRYTGGLFANLGNVVRLSVLEDMRRNHQVREGMRPGSMGTRQSGNISNSYFKF